MKPYLSISMLAGCGALLYASAGHAQQSYPSKPVRMLVLSSAGGSTDLVARLAAHALSEGMGQSVVIDNRPGAGGIIATELTAHARPDGYTILMVNTSHSAQPSMHSDLPYDPIKDFSPISMVAVTYSLLIVNPAVPAKNVKELIDLAKAQPGKLNYPSGTNGSSAHYGMELLKLMAGIDIVKVPYKGTAENLNALLSGEVQVGLITLPAAVPHLNSGRLRVLAIGSAKRSPKLPNVPSIAETLPGFDVSTWLGLLAPAHTPQPIIARINGVIAKLSRDPAARDNAANQGMELVTDTPQEFSDFIKTSIERYAKVVKATGMRSD